VLKKLEVNIHKNALFSKTDKLLVAFSGGVDSVVLSDLLHKAGYQFDLAHCNFQLRGNEANQDTEFCEIYAKSISTNCHIAYFNTKEYATENKLSIQMAARELRYNWFKELLEIHGYSHILTAHHANDTIETLFVNLIRGTGIKGLQGIPEKQNSVIRPLLFATKDEIRHYAKHEKLSFREDSSNQEVKYKRNFIRHQIIPELKKLNPALEETLVSSIGYFKQSSEIVAEFAKQKFKEICKEENKQLFIDIDLILKEAQKETLLFEWLNNKGFKSSQIEQLTESLTSEQHVGKQFSSASHQLVIDRKYIIVQKLQLTNSQQEYTISSIDYTSHLPINLTFEITTDPAFPANSNEIKIPYSDNLFPFTLRKWKQGDKFQPLGMKGSKKLSDFFKDQKLSLFDKTNCWILESKEHIIWVVGYRIDDRCKVVEGTERILRIKVIDN
jgi:tRNA(Ile)-lysidine synthase